MVWDRTPETRTVLRTMANTDNNEHEEGKAVDLEEGSMLGAQRRQGRHMGTTPPAATAALYTMASLQPSDAEIYMLSELQRALLLHSMAVVLHSDDNVCTTAASVATVLWRSTRSPDADAACRALEAFVKSHRGEFLWSLVPMGGKPCMDTCLPLDVRDARGHTLAEHLLSGGSDEQLECVTHALGRGVHIPPMRLVEWPSLLVQSPCFLAYVAEHVPAKDAALGWQDREGKTVTMRIAAMPAPSPKYCAAQKLWLETWSAAACRPEVQDHCGRTVAMYLARCGIAEVQKVWLQKWSPADCCSRLQSNNGYTVAMDMACCASADVQRLWLEKWSAADCGSHLQNLDGVTVAMYLAKHGSADVQKPWLAKWSAADCFPTCRTAAVVQWPCTSPNMRLIVYR